MKMVFNETLRLAPPATTLDRIVAEDTEVCGQRLVKGTVVGLVRPRACVCMCAGGPVCAYSM